MAKRAEIVGLYPENGWDYDSIESILKSRTSIKRYILALHDQDVDADGKPVKPHHHVYLDFGNTNWQYEDIAKWFGIPPNMVGKIKADPKDKHPIIGRYAVIRYYTHAACPEKHFYPISSFRTNIADIEDFYAKQQEAALNRTKTGRHDSELADFIERCSAGEILPYNYWKYIPPQLYSQNASQFKNAWKMYHDARIAKAMGNRDCQILGNGAQVRPPWANSTPSSWICPSTLPTLGATPWAVIKTSLSSFWTNCGQRRVLHTRNCSNSLTHIPKTPPNPVTLTRWQWLIVSLSPLFSHPWNITERSCPIARPLILLVNCTAVFLRYGTSPVTLLPPADMICLRTASFPWAPAKIL